MVTYVLRTPTFQELSMYPICRWFSCSFLLFLLQGCVTAPTDYALTSSVDSASDLKEPSIRVIDLGAQAIPACHEVNQPPGKSLCVFAPLEDASLDEHRFRIAVGEPDWSKDPDAIGVALSGGGTRAAANAMGVLAGLDDLGLLTHVKPGNKKRVELISSVSGGGYAAYYLYSHLLHPANIPVDQGELFHDCVTRFTSTDDRGPYALESLVKQVKPYMCSDGTYALNASKQQHAWEGDGKRKQARHQALLRCHQDVLEPSECSFQVTSYDTLGTAANLVLMAGASVLTAPLHHFANSLFDSGMNLSPSRAAYVNGINLTYGGLIAPEFKPTFQVPDRVNTVTKATISCDREAGKKTSLANYSLFECDESTILPQPKPWSISTFAKSLMSKRGIPENTQNAINSKERNSVRNHPYWIIQATSAPTRGLLGWLRKGENQPDIRSNSFEFTATHFGSRRYGFLPGNPAKLEVVDAVASAAAFLDSNQQALGGTIIRPAIATALHLFNANWGIDIPNYNNSPLRRNLHRITPFPLNNIDAIGTAILESGPRENRLISTFIRLTDGGNTENLAAYAQIRRGVKNIIISDGAADADGSFGDLCRLKVALSEDSNDNNNNALHIYIPGLERFNDLCSGNVGDAEVGYNMKDWQHDLPILLGCIQSVAAESLEEQCSTTAADAGKVVSRIFLYKPSMRKSAFKSAIAASGIAECKVIDYIDQSSAVSKLIRSEKLPTLCTGSTGVERSLCQAALPCEVARLIRNNGNKNPSFPIGDAVWLGPTIAVTANSSGTLFSSYREQARHAMHEISGILLDEGNLFYEELNKQRTQPTKLSLKK